ncbi:MAG: hypothetical protein Q9O62_10320 [Ardenticatenia bacterium]|nr:hypothetical protein [Ardenticatenia bacterium]
MCPVVVEERFQGTSDGGAREVVGLCDELIGLGRQVVGPVRGAGVDLGEPMLDVVNEVEEGLLLLGLLVPGVLAGRPEERRGVSITAR